MIDIKEVLAHLEILNIPKDVDYSIDDLERSYKLMAKFYHPDINKSSNSEEKMKIINSSYKYLKDNFTQIKVLRINNLDFKESTNDKKNYKLIFKKIIIILIWISLIGIISGILLSFLIAILSGQAW